MVFLFCCEEDPLVTNETHITTCSVVATHRCLLSAGCVSTRLFCFEPGAHYGAPLGSAGCETQKLNHYSIGIFAN